MSTMRATETFFHAGGMEEGGTRRPADHPLVEQFPCFYRPLEPHEDPALRAPVPPKAPRARPKPTAEPAAAADTGTEPSGE